ncbi:MAG: hypothetical protein EU541_08415 [Promethearchaeota archaeon]|nr:MAG: hypothetical protein EU541_08415 [Candidatus Lokiarchaeota archaeon]
MNLADEKKEEPKKSEEIDYENLEQYTVKELRDIAKDKDISIPSGSRKDDIITTIQKGVGVIEVPEDLVHKKIKVEYWRTRLHDEELGVHQQMKYQAKTRRFSKNFDIEGKVSIDGEETHIIAFNKEEWEEAEQNEEASPLTVRIFTIMEETMDLGTGGNFHGGIELSIAHSLVQSYEVKRPAPVFFMQLPRTYNLARVVMGWRILGTRWTWPLLPEKKEDQFQMVTAKGTIGPGRNYNVYIGEKKIARIDGQFIQKEYEIEIYDKNYAEDTDFEKQIILFACACNFMDDVEDIIKKLYKEMEKTGTSSYQIPKREMDLFKNPRLMRR